MKKPLSLILLALSLGTGCAYADGVTKLDPNDFQIVATTPPQVVTQVYDVNVLQQELLNVQADQLNYDNAAAQRIKDLQTLIAQAATVGVQPQPVQIQPAPEPLQALKHGKTH